jgi:DNA-binding transcriptional regulator YiaG
LAPDCSIPLAIPFSELAISLPLPDKRPFPKSVQTIGDHIKTYRLTHNILIKDIIPTLGVDRETLRGWEQGLFHPLLRHYPRIIKLLGYIPFETDETTLAGKIKKYRYINGLTQRQFANLINADIVTVWKWEKRNITPLPETQKVLHALLESK